MKREEHLKHAKRIETIDDVAFGLTGQVSPLQAVGFESEREPCIAHLARAWTSEERELNVLAWIPGSPEGAGIKIQRRDGHADRLAYSKALDKIRNDAQAFLLQAIDEDPTIHPDFDAWKAGQDAGTPIDPAPPALSPWLAPSPDPEIETEKHPFLPIHGFEPQASPLIVAMDLRPHMGVPLLRALKNPAAQQERFRLFHQENQLQGYPWYDEIPQLVGVKALARRGHRTSSLRSLPLESRNRTANVPVRPDSIVFELSLADSQGGSPRIIEIQADLAFAGDPQHAKDIPHDSRPVIGRNPQELAPSELGEMIAESFFAADHDHDSDSPDTEERRYRKRACRFAADVLLSPQEANEERIRQAAHESLLWELPQGKDARISLRRNPAGSQAQARDGMISVQVEIQDSAE